MPCFSPLKGYRNREFDPEKKSYGITFNSSKALNPDNPEIMPCGYCVGCRVAKSTEWGIRTSHEAQLYQFGNGSSFLTLTFRPEDLPHDNSIRKKHLQAFFWKLRKLLPKGVRVRFVECGEYGDKHGRAHYHVILFNWAFPDRKLDRIKGGFRLYRSDLLEEAWPFGEAQIGDVSFATGKYVASYTLKKVAGKAAKQPYIRAHPVTGELHDVVRPFALMSLKPGIGKGWLDKFKSDVYPCGYVVMKGGVKLRLPEFYVDKFTPEEQAFIKRQRKLHAKLNSEDSTPERLRAREECLRLKLRDQERKL